MPVAVQLDAPPQITIAIQKASRATGADFEYLIKTARRESGFNRKAKSPRSSATGLFQFIEKTWLTTLKEEGPALGLGKYANKIFKTRNGKYYVPEEETRTKILNLRKDPEIASLLAAAYSKSNATFLKNKLGRQPKQGELYLAHFLGPTSAARMIQLAKTNPQGPAHKAFPKAAQANPSIFYANGKAKSIKSVYAQLMSAHQTTTPVETRPSKWQVEVKNIGRIMPAKGVFQTTNIDVAREKNAGSIGIWRPNPAPGPALKAYQARPVIKSR